MSSKNNRLLFNSLIFLTVLSLFGAVLMVFLYAPIERTMGMVQKVFYFHVSAAWVGMLAFLLTAVFGILYLRSKALKWDRMAASSVEIGLLFTIIAVLTGSIWARPVWNTWWTWDPRLTTVTLMGFTYLAYLLLRRGVDNRERRARFSAIYSIVGFLSVPLTFFSARLMRTIHPVVFTTAGTDEGLTPAMVQTLMVSLLAFTLLFALLLWQRSRLAFLQAEVDELLLADQDHTDKEW